MQSPIDYSIFFKNVQDSDRTTNTQQLTKSNSDNNSSNNQDSFPNPADIKFYPMPIPEPQVRLYEYIMTRHPPSWSSFFLSAQAEVWHACVKVEEECNKTGKAFLPLIPRVLNAFWACPLSVLKCVILGQDPYPGFTRTGMPKAIGLSFASDRENEIPDSLNTVYEELARTVEDWEHPRHPDLRCWGRQGVLLLNSALTVEANRAEAHVGFWKPFTTKFMEYMNENCNHVVFLLWGKKAQKVADIIYTTKHLKLNAYHPSPMSKNSGYSFVGCDHFNKANLYLVENGIHPIDWRIPK
jgi:uracil-DNA glycosylase